jgi:hypothetical protein
MTIITEHRLRRLFADRGYRVHEIRCNRHYWVQVERESGSPRFFVSVGRHRQTFVSSMEARRRLLSSRRTSGEISWKRSTPPMRK